jgi:hypothetical protein
MARRQRHQLLAQAAEERVTADDERTATYQALRMNMMVSSSGFFVSGQGSKEAF